MKKVLVSTLILLTLILTACGASSTTGADSTTAGNTATGELPAATRLIVGTFKLEDTEYAVTPEQASELLVMWQVYRELAQSDTAAQAETDALLQQIEDTMTDEQMQAIDGMGLSQQDVFALMQEQGIAMGAGPNAEQIATAQAGGGGFTPPDGGFPGGGIPGQNPGGGGGQGLTPDQIATAQASRGGGGASPNRVPTPLIEALIQLLQERAGS